MSKHFVRGLAVALLTAIACGHGQPVGQPPPGATTPPAPLDATQFVQAIPRCQALGPLLAAHDVREREPGTKVSVRGMLVHHPKWDCTKKACSQSLKTGPDGHAGPAACCNTCATPWFVVDAAEVSRPYMSRARLYLREHGQTEPLGLTARDCDVRGINTALPPKDVVVSGVLEGQADQGGGSYLLNDARLCTP